jgi:HK97 family phage major capsid protein
VEKELLEKIQSEVGVLLATEKKATESQIKSLEERIADIPAYDDATLKTYIDELSAKIEALKENAAEKKVSLRDQLLANKAKLQAIKGGDNSKVVLKVVGDMSITGNVTGDVPQAQRIAGLNTIATRRPIFLDYLTRASATSNKIDWVYQTGREGAAGGTDEAATKNKIDFDLVVASQAIVKRTALIRVTDEMLDDIDFIQSEINNELMRLLTVDIENTAFSGNNTAPAMNGIYTQATTFAAGTFANTIYNANNVDVLAVAMNQIMIAEQGMPTHIFMHPSDVTALKFEKVTTTDRRYVDRLLEVGGTLSMDGMPIIPTTLVAVGTFLMGDMNRAYLYIKDDVTIEIGMNGDDFAKNFRTIRAEFRGATVVKNNDRTAFVKGTFSTAKAALLLT